MTELECRMLYKADTGEYPTYGVYPKLSGAYPAGNYEGALKPEYTIWLEQRQNDLWIEEKYQHDTSFPATYIRDYTEKVYTKGYKEWLEKRECQKT